MSNCDEPTTPVLALREAFGDRKPPDISRKITACVACRKQKIKCHMRDSRPPCTRCQKRGLPCTVNRSLQMLLENDTSWKHSMEQKMRKLEATVGRLANESLSPRAREQLGEEMGEASASNRHVGGKPQLRHDQNNDQPANHWEIVMDLDSGPEAIPGFYISQIPATAGPHGAADFISKGVVSLESAQRYFDKYRDRIDHFPYRILNDQGPVDLESVRKSSPLLAAAVCTVGALHAASKDFELCYKEFASLCAMQTLSKRSTVDDVRALCIGAFWLSDLSWTLVGTAVRIATELQLHKSIFKAMQGDRQHYLRTRLWYLIYACDHHFSIAYGRPPMTRECEAVRNVRSFLACEHATEDDARLASQVLRWSICSNIFDTFGVNVDRPLSDEEVTHLKVFSASLDDIRAEWVDKFVENVHVGNYPRKGVTLQYHFAKLYLFSHAFRGSRVGNVSAGSPGIGLELENAANSAVLSAVSIMRAVVSDTEIQSFLDGLPIYFNVMVAFAAVFLLKVSTKFSASVKIDVEETRSLMATLVSTLRGVTSTMHPKHLLVSITEGIDSLLKQCDPSEDVTTVESVQQQQLGGNVDVPNAFFTWGGDQYGEPGFMGEYDFLLGQDLSFDMNLPEMDHSFPPVP